jgi:Coenzyme PQQ synthesis protein D (PqqD)
MTNERPRTAQGLEFNEVEDGLIVYQESTERVHHLNPTAAIVFQLCDGSRDATEIASIVAELFGLEHPPADAVESCIARFVQERLVR